MSPALFQPFQPLAAIATTPQAVTTLRPFCQLTATTLWVPPPLTERPDTQTYCGSIAEHVAILWPQHRSFVFCLATGAVVRLIAPLLDHKSSDPAVVVVDAMGQYVISLCSGHQGGADQLAQQLAIVLNATPVLTGASTAAGLPSIDTLGEPFGWQRGQGDWNAVSGVIARHQPAEVIQNVGSCLWQQHLPTDHPFLWHHLPGISHHRPGSDPVNNPCSVPPTPPILGGTSPQNYPELGDLGDQSQAISPQQKPTQYNCPQARIWISHSLAPHPLPQIPTVSWHPRVLWVGIGCERGTSQWLIQTAIDQVFEQHQLTTAAIAGLATIDLKADEVGLVQLCQTHHWPLECFAASVLRNIPVPTPSVVVEAEVGTASVAEAAALQAAQGAGLAAEFPALLVSKQIVRNDNEPGAVTVAVAQAEQEVTGRQGQLLLVGMGPGAMDQMTPAAHTAVCHADAVIGYGLYLELLQVPLRLGQIVESYPITQERQRAQRAIALAQWGLTVAVVSSGDAGIYGMAGLVLEELRVQGWDGVTPAVEIFPGVSAVQAAAARVGTPLMHDFCAISLSDRLTPWPVIVQRLEAAAQADFVTALYNPRSQERVNQLNQAQEIFLRYRQAATPVAIVRAAYRQDEHIEFTTLDQLHTMPVDMLTTVLIGNQSTRMYHNWMMTPRGYLDRQSKGEEAKTVSSP